MRIVLLFFCLEPGDQRFSTAVLAPYVIFPENRPNIAVKSFRNLPNSEKTVPIFEENAGIVSFVSGGAEILQGMIPVPFPELFYQQRVSTRCRVKFRVGQKVLAADILAHAFFKPNAAFITSIKPVQKQLAVVDKLMPQNLQHMIFG